MKQESGQGIFHFRVTRAGSVASFLSAEGYSQDDLERWFYMGAIYLDGKRLRANADVKQEQILRLHTKPKHYHWAPGPLTDRIVFDDPELLVLDKPAGLPVHATLDNYVENAKFILESELGRPLYSTHRLDIPTSGLLILAKSPEAQAVLNKTFAKRRVEKVYHAGTSTRPPLGEHALYLNPASRVPRESSASPMPGWWECRLRITGCVPSDEIYVSRIELLTGRTHQIRAQLAALKVPILGDVTYGSAEEYVHERLALESYSLSLTFRSRTLAIKRPRSMFSTVPHS